MLTDRTSLDGKLRFIDTFAGIGGFRLGMERACRELGVRNQCVASVEIDEDAKDTYYANFVDRPWGDITKIEASAYPDHDFLLGGFPCQPFSRNGKFYNHNDRTLGDDDRKNLCTYLMTILREKRPAFFVFENVKEIQSIRNGDGTPFMQTLVGNLEECGYEVRAKVLNTAEFGLPQQRKRMYFVGTRDDIFPAMDVAPRKAPLNLCVADMLDADVGGSFGLAHLWRKRMLNGGMDGMEDNGIDGVLRRLEEKGIEKPGYASGLRKWREDKGRTISRLDALLLAYQGGDWPRPTRKTGRITPVAIIYGDTPSGLPRQQDKLYSKLGISPTIATFSTPCFDVDRQWRMLTPRECARLQGFPESFELPSSNSKAYRQVGNAVTVDVVFAVLRPLVEAFKAQIIDSDVKMA